MYIVTKHVTKLLPNIPNYAKGETQDRCLTKANRMLYTLEVRTENAFYFAKSSKKILAKKIPISIAFGIYDAPWLSSICFDDC